MNSETPEAGARRAASELPSQRLRDVEARIRRVNVKQLEAEETRRTIEEQFARLDLEREKRDRFGSIWPALVITIPYLVLLLTVSVLFGPLEVPFTWSLLIALPLALATVRASWVLFASRSAERILADEQQLEEALRKLDSELARYAAYLAEQERWLDRENHKRELLTTSQKEETARRVTDTTPQGATNLRGVKSWGHLVDDEFKHFVAQVLHSLGFDVWSLPASDPSFIDLIANRRGRRFAICCRGCKGAVHSETVQRAHTGSSAHRCEETIVVTNSAFTRNAIRLSKKLGIRLIDRPLLDPFVAGKILGKAKGAE